MKGCGDMKKVLSGILLASLVFFCFLPSLTSTWSPEDFKRLVKTIEIKGEVRYPGVYEMDWDANIDAIIKKAGGTNELADLSAINLSKIVENNSIIVIPKQSAKKKISINSASLDELDTLNGIGPAIAQRIIDYRKKQPFVSLEQLKEVKGIGDKIFDKIKDDIIL